MSRRANGASAQSWGVWRRRVRNRNATGAMRCCPRDAILIDVQAVGRVSVAGRAGDNEQRSSEDGAAGQPRLYGNRFAGLSHGGIRVPCNCQMGGAPTTLHTPQPDTDSEAWQALVGMIETSEADGREVFAPGRELPPGLWDQINTLPREIERLTSVKHLLLYGSAMTAIPPQIGSMVALEKFVPYTSYGLHWFPYEITRCTKLTDSTVSTRAIYGNPKNRMWFPQLPAELPEHLVADTCSVCGAAFDGAPIQRWISLTVANDTLPLLVQACSESCLSELPRPPAGYVPYAHQGGPTIEQTPPR